MQIIKSDGTNFALGILAKLNNTQIKLVRLNN
jgi:hypothetical protein